ncbi:E1-E2 ATPase-domain-containing protein [Lipomyces japonicus]|uniref:E1-E2 ATPase-domain-containing protein n=1 Tax=Lipomyces japonicus TaxID=56871 RepID=UPI0034CFB593
MDSRSLALPDCEYCCRSDSRSTSSPDNKEMQACCDSDCLEVAAQRECGARKTRIADMDDHSMKECCSGNDHVSAVSTTPCDKHIRVAYERYAALLGAAGCSCKDLIARNFESCCSSIRIRKKPRSSYNSVRSRTSVSSIASAMSTGYSRKACDRSSEGQQKPDICAKTSCREVSITCDTNHDIAGKEDDSFMKENDCCGVAIISNRRDSSFRNPPPSDDCSCCGEENNDYEIETSPNTCCSELDSDDKISNSKYIPALERCDIEKGCENKLYRALNAIPDVRNLQTSLRISSHGEYVDVVISGDAKRFVNKTWPHGVIGMVALNKKTVRITDLVYNTFDIELTLAAPAPSAELMSGARHVSQTAHVTALSVVLTIPVLVLAWAPLPPHKILFGAISLALATIVQIVVAGPCYPSALKAFLFTNVIEMDLLIVLSTSTAYIFFLVAFAYQVRGNPLSTGEFFETSTLLVTLIMFGRLVSAFARHKAVESISIRSLQADTVTLVGPIGSDDTNVDVRLLQYGDVFKVLPDSYVATDGIVISGQSKVDESSITSEVVPVKKIAGSNIVAGCLNGSGVLTVRLTRLPGENTISEIAAMVDAAKFSKPKVQQVADRIASYFVPVIVGLTLITFVIWIAIGIAIRTEKGSAVVPAITYAISVLIVSCPCAIGLAVPMVVVIAGGVGARRGVVFKSAETLEVARKVTHVVFDKTGTLTQGKMSVLAEEYLCEVPSFAASLALGLAINSKHPVAVALATYLQEKAVEPASVEAVKSVTGSGIEAICIGQGLTVFCLAQGEELLACYRLNDSLRPEAITVVTELRRRNIAICIISGDEDGAVQKVGCQLGISEEHIRSRCSPEDKQRYIKTIMENNDNIVLFCGEGTKDAVALAQANIGLHVSSGTDVAQSAADAVLVRPVLSGILTLIELSQAAFHRIVFNFFWSFIYNIFAILLAAGAFVNARIPPQYAGLGEIVSVLPVILIALQLKWFKSY